ncbi:MAG TPA: UPF0158 family protein [Myxococcota bacterium]
MELEIAFESHDPSSRLCLDRKTGAIVDGDGDNEDLIPIEAIPSREQYRMMERFIATVVNVPLRDALQDAIVGKGAFRRFKDAVGRHPDERKRWFAFRDALLHRFILDWLKAHRLELQEVPAWNLEPPMTPSPEPPEGPSPLAPPPGAAGAPASTPPAVVIAERHERADIEALRTYLQSWARAHGEEYRYLFGPAAFERLAGDLAQEFSLTRKRPS